MILLLSLLTLKHFVWDFWYQPPYMWQNKGTFLHPGGILHSGLHAVTTFILLTFFMANPLGALILAVGEFLVHYTMDFCKMNLNRIKGWGATTHNEFWILTGFDQLVHSFTYIAIIAILF